MAGHAKSTPPRMTAGTPAKRRLVGDEDAQPAVKKLCSESPAKASPSKKARAPQPELVKAAIEDADEVCLYHVPSHDSLPGARQRRRPG